MPSNLCARVARGFAGATMATRRLAVPFALACLVLPPAPARAQSTDAIVATYAKDVIRRGRAPGVGVAVVYGSARPRTFTFGDAVVAAGSTPVRRFRDDDYFEIGSVTKVFTTNLVGQAVADGRLSLGRRLSTYRTTLGKLGPSMKTVTLRQLGDFTAGIEDYAPLCDADPVPGCLPSARPPIGVYTAADFATYFAGAVPQNFAVKPSVPATSLPAPYYYSDYSLGLLGLLLAAPDGPLTNVALDRWSARLGRELLEPLGMTRTVLAVPATQLGRRVAGYRQARADATVAAGAVSGIELVTGGGGYAAAPAVRIRGGGGRGARAIAPGTRGGGGALVAVVVASGGAGYAEAPPVTLRGGRAAAGRDATLKAHVANGRVAYVAVVDGGSGYVPPLSVVVEPGAATNNVVPIWAPAGALKTSLADLARFSRAALLSLSGSGAVPDPIAAGFRIATRPSACVGPDPALATCPRSSPRSALAWAIAPADAANRIPEVVSKDGALPGFSTFVALMPKADIAVVVMINTDTPAKPGTAVENLAHDILYSLYACRRRGRCAR